MEIINETAKEILETVFKYMVKNFFDSAEKQSYITAKKILRDICPVKAKKACKKVAEKYGITIDYIKIMREFSDNAEN